ncbi:MAG: hypothetical protein AAF631_10205 [Pseudomonadota bacterium]
MTDKNYLMVRRCLAALLTTTAIWAAPVPSAQGETVAADATLLTAVAPLETAWQARADDLTAVRDALARETADQKNLDAAVTEQLELIEGAKAGLNTAVLRVAEAQRQLKKINVTVEDKKGAALSQKAQDARQMLDTLVAKAAAEKKRQGALTQDLANARATVEEMKKAVAAARAAASAANLVVEAVKSAQLTIAKAAESSAEPADTGIETEFFSEAVAQAAATEKSAEVAQRALTLTMEREKILATELAATEAALKRSATAEEAALAAFGKADKALSTHRATWAEAETARKAEVDAISADLSAAQEQLNSQKAILQDQSITLQDRESKANSARQRVQLLQSNVGAAETAFADADTALRAAQTTRAMQTAAVLARRNGDLKARMRAATDLPQTADARFALPGDQLFAPRSANLREAEAPSIDTLAQIAATVTGDLPAELDWVLRVDVHAPGRGEEGWFLGHARAMAVANRFARTAGIPLDRLSVAAFADASGDGRLEIALTTR